MVNRKCCSATKVHKVDNWNNGFTKIYWFLGHYVGQSDILNKPHLQKHYYFEMLQKSMSRITLRNLCHVMKFGFQMNKYLKNCAFAEGFMGFKLTFSYLTFSLFYFLKTYCMFSA